MIPADVPANEGDRLRALKQMEVLDTGAEERFDRLTRLAQDMFKAPIALVSLVDTDRQWFKSRQGLEVTETPREVAFCSHAIRDDEVLVVPDASLDPRFFDNPLVTGSPDLRFYAGAQLRSPDGLAVGTLCVLDTVAREWTDEDSASLRDLADVVEVELRQALVEDQQRALLALTAVTALSQESEPRDLLRSALTIGGNYLDLPIGIVSHIEGDDYEVIVQVSPDGALEDGQHFSLGTTYCHLTLNSDEVLAIPNMKGSTYSGHPCYTEFGMESYIGVVINVDGERYGTLSFSSPEPRVLRDFSEADKDFLRLLSRWVATILRRWQLDRTVAEQQRIAQVITRAQATFIQRDDESLPFETLLEDILELTGCAFGFIGEVRRRESGTPYLKTQAITNIAWNEATRKLYEENAETGMEFENPNTLFGITLTAGVPVISKDFKLP